MEDSVFGLNFLYDTYSPMKGGRHAHTTSLVGIYYASLLRFSNANKHPTHYATGPSEGSGQNESSAEKDALK